MYEVVTVTAIGKQGTQTILPRLTAGNSEIGDGEGLHDEVKIRDELGQ